jgi:formylglycine-generating enzyme required for sulfatase activity
MGALAEKFNSEMKFRKLLAFIRCLAIALALHIVGASESPAQQPSGSEQPTQQQKQKPVGHRADNQDMAMIPDGTTQMGIDPSDIPRLQKLFDVDELGLFEPAIPRHRVALERFYIDRHLVTNRQFKVFTEVNSSWLPQHIRSDLHNGNYLRHWKGGVVPTGRENHPVVNVSWYAAVAYCQWMGKRLPTEAEFEYSGRGGLLGLFPWGNEPADMRRANFSGAGVAATTVVGSYPPNGFGLFDMAGNVWEFLADEWRSYGPEAQRNPNPGGDLFDDGDSFLRITSRRVIRGGSFEGEPINLWLEYRDSHPPQGAKDFVGFRCAKSWKAQ